MEPTATLYSSILLLGAAHGVFLAVALFSVSGGDPRARRYLALLTLVFAMDLGVDYLYESRYLLLAPRLAYVEDLASYLYGPLTWLYVKALTSRDASEMPRRIWLHFVPLLLSIGLLMPFFSLSRNETVRLVYSGYDAGSALGAWVLVGILVQVMPIPQVGTYLFFSVRHVIRHGRSIQDQFSSIERISLVWLRNLLVALGVLYGLWVLALFLGDVVVSETGAERMLDLATIIVIYTMGYLGLRQPAIFTGHGTANLTPGPTDSAARDHKYEKSALDPETSHALLQDLERHMANEKPYLKSDLTLAELARQLSISTNYLSQIINEQTRSNFFDYINRHRVSAAKQMLVDANRARDNVLTIGFDAGFNSKTAYYSAFKKHVGQTPLQYRASQSLNDE